MSGDVTSNPAPATPEKEVFAVKIEFSGTYSEVGGVIAIVINATARNLDRISTVVVSSFTELRIGVTKPIKAMEAAIISAKLGGKTAQQLGIEVQEYVTESIRATHLDEVIAACRSRNNAEMTAIFEEIISKAIADSNVSLTIEVEEIKDEPIKIPDASPAPSPLAAAPPAAPIPETTGRTGRTEVKVDPILSPVRGVVIKDLKPGMTIMVSVRDSGFNQRNIQRMLMARTGTNDLSEVEAIVHEVSLASTDRYRVITELAPNIIGVANISGELRVKPGSRTVIISQPLNTPAKAIVLPKTIAMKEGISTSAFVAVVILIFTTIGLLAYWLFGV